MADISTTYLRNYFEGFSISRICDIPWPARSPDLSVCDFSYTFKVYETRLRSLYEIKQRITDEIQAISQQMLEDVFKS